VAGRCGLIVLLAIIAYSNSFLLSFNFDDAANILSNPLIREFDLEGVKRAFQTPRGVGILSFQINYQLAGHSVVGYHLINLSIHLITALMIYRLLVLIAETPSFNKGEGANLRLLPVPFIVALIFAVHPVQTQAVTYIVQRFTSLAALFYVAATISYLQARLDQIQSGTLFGGRSIAWLVACVLCTLAACNTKEISYTLPLALLLLEGICFSFNRKKIAVVTLLALTVMGAIALKVGLGNVSLEQALFTIDEATRMQTTTSRFDYLCTQFRVIMTYIRLLFLPINQSIDYDYTLSHSFFEPGVVASFAVIMVLLAAAILLLRKSRDGNAAYRLTALGIFWFFLTISIESSVLPIIDLIFEHRLYLPSIGAITAVTTTGLYLVWRRGGTREREIACVVALLIATVLAGATWKRNLVWRTEVTLWQDATAKKPLSGRAWNNLGGAYIKERDADKALRALVRSIELDPSKAAAWNNLGIAIDLKGVYRDRFNKTREMFSSPQSIESDIMGKWLGDVYNNLGLAYEILGDYHKAAGNYRLAMGYNPALGLAYYNLGLVSAATGNAEVYVEQQQILQMVDPVLGERLQRRVTGQ
jgi:tetratricopeptide (TPR) repeat protein